MGRSREQQHESGFTLVEVLVVIVILGVLAGIVTISVGGLSHESDAAACKADRASVQKAVQAYWAKNRSFPTAVDDVSSSATTLVGAGLLRSAPSGTGYTITFDPATGSVGPATCPG